MAQTLTATGSAKIISSIFGSTVANPKYIAWGTGSGTALLTNQALFGEAPQDGRATGTISTISTNVANDTIQVVGTLTASSNKTITNFGIYDSSTLPATYVLQTAINSSTTNIISFVPIYGTTPSYPFNVQIANEVVSVTSSAGTNMWNVTRGVGGTIKYPSIAATTPITTVSGNLYGIADVESLELNSGDSVTITFEIQMY